MLDIDLIQLEVFDSSSGLCLKRWRRLQDQIS